MNRTARDFLRQAKAIVVMAAVAVLFTTDAAVAQISQISVDATMLTSGYSQNFDSLGTSTTATLPTGWKFTAAGAGTTAGWSTAQNVTATTAQASSGSPTAGGIYNWGSTTTDRAPGFMTSGGYASPNGLLFGLTNSTTRAITGLTLAFDYERYRINTAAASVTFFGSIDGSTWTSITEGDSGSFSTGSSSYTFTGGTVVSKSGITISSLNIGRNQSYYLKWNFNTTGSSSQGIGLDNFQAAFTSTGGGGANYYWVGSDSTLGGSGDWDATGGTAWRPTDTDGTGEAWDPSKNATFGGASAGTVTVSDTVTANAGLQFSTTGYTLTGGTVSLGGANAAANTITTDVATSIAIASVLGGSNGLTKAGGGSLELSAANTLSGGITVSGGSLVVAAGEALGSNAVTITGGTLSSDATPRTIANAITFTDNGGLAVAGSGDLDLSGPVSFANAVREISVGGGVTATLSGTYGTGGFTKAGAGTLVLGKPASLTGIGVSAGTLRIPAGVAVSTSSQPTATGGMLEIDGTLVTTSTSSWTAPTAPVTIGSTGTLVQQGNGSPTSVLFDQDVIWTAGSTFILRNFTNSPSVSGRTYAMNLAFDSIDGPTNVGAISGTSPWTVQGDFTIGENVNFNYGTYSGSTTYSGNVIVGGVLGATNGARSFTIGAGKELRLANTGGLNIASGQTVTISGGVRSTATDGQTAAITGGTLSLGNGVRTFDVAAGTGNAGLSVASVVEGGGLTKVGAGRLTLSGTNTYTGATTINAGALSISADANLGDASGGITLGGGTLEMSGGFTLGPGRTITAATGTSSTIAVASGTVAFAGPFAGSGDLDKAGPGTLSVGNVSTGYSGTFTISAGTLEVTAATALANATLTQTGGTLLLAPTGGGDVVVPEIGGGGGEVTIDSGANAVFRGNTNRAYSGRIRGQGALKKEGAGTLTLNGDNDFVGTTRIAEGGLKLGANGTLAATLGIDIDAGAIFDVTDQASFTLRSGQQLRGRGTMLGNIQFGNGSQLVFDPAGPLLVGSGTVSFAAGFGVGSIVGLDGSVAVGTYTLLNETSGGSVSLAGLANVGPSSAFDLGGGKSAYFQQGSLELVVVPEPSTLVMLGGLGLALAGFGACKRRPATRKRQAN